MSQTKKYTPEAEYIYNEQAPVAALESSKTQCSNYTTPDWEECESVKKKADALPHLVLVPSEDTVSDVVLQLSARVVPFLDHGKKSGHNCLDDDVFTQDKDKLETVKKVMKQLLEGLFLEPSKFEK
ncbi:hypothetical protein EJ07DRAFT_182716 [Lizonia empirigonia]|nr:hypothetical protein EJ07DRAFT_182716 [Lizonia empirigonia]